jgi:hypothetical protein
VQCWHQRLQRSYGIVTLCLVCTAYTYQLRPLPHMQISYSSAVRALVRLTKVMGSYLHVGSSGCIGGPRCGAVVALDPCLNYSSIWGVVVDLDLHVSASPSYHGSLFSNVRVLSSVSSE